MIRIRIAIIACFTLFFFSLSAQDAEETKILAARDDSAKIKKLADYAHSFVDSDRKKATRLYDELMRLSKKLNDPYWVGMVWYNRGYINAKAANDSDAIRHFDSAVVYLKQTDRIDMLAYAHMNIGSIAERLGNTNEKISRITEVIRLLQNTKSQRLLSNAYSSMGVLFFNLDEFDKGLSYFQQAAAIAKANKDTAVMVEALFGMANCLSSQKKFNTALSQANEAVRIAALRGQDYSLSVAHTSLAEVYRKWEKPGLSIAHAKKALEFATAANDVQYQLIGMLGLADGYRLAKDYPQSIRYYSQALRLGREKAAVIQLDDIYKGLSEDYEQLNDDGKALEYYKKFIIYRDSASNVKIKRNATELELKYQTTQKEKILSQNKLLLAQKDLQLQKNRNYIYYSLAALVGALLIAAILYLQSRYKKMSHARALQSIQQQKELQLLQALMQGEEKERNRIAKDLHDGVAGMLAAVKMHFSSTVLAGELSKDESYLQGMRLLNEATEEIRKTSHNLMPEVLLQHGLDIALNRYCNSINNSRGLQIQYDSWGAIDRFSDSFELSVYRIVQELLNNIIKHSKAKQAMVQLTQQNGLLSISIEDDGVGFEKEAHASDGMGLKSLQRRIEAMNGKIEMQGSGEAGVVAYLEFEVSHLKREITIA
ncbi:tetratricopeptide repeat protein [Niabella sp.]|uniref:tetratricopeptide repeat-containing sensor histidine kinase n=1 Tax=Niabella sp. TaxID=1962976 RepID=UPI0026041F32|nr:tetratricopeptide repeat protein [Niabella sp.]